MEILANIADLIALITWLPEAELPRKDNSAVRVLTGLELCE